MKAVLVLCLLGLAYATALECGDGRPGCLLPAELERLWKNNEDETKYWACEVLGQPGVSKNCPSDRQLFLNLPSKPPHKPRCVEWDEWQWEELYDPLTCGN